MARLGLRREAFCREYLKTGIAAEACRRAGYPDGAHEYAAKQGHRLMRNDEVNARLDEMLAEAAAKSVKMQDFTPDMIFGLILDKAMNGTQEGAQVRCLELMAKAKRMLVDRIETQPGDKAQALETLVAKITEADPLMGAYMAKSLGLEPQGPKPGETVQ